LLLKLAWNSLQSFIRTGEIVKLWPATVQTQSRVLTLLLKVPEEDQR